MVEELLGYLRDFLFSPPQTSSWTQQRAEGLVKVSVLLEILITVRGRSCARAEEGLRGFSVYLY